MQGKDDLIFAAKINRNDYQNPNDRNPIIKIPMPYKPGTTIKVDCNLQFDYGIAACATSVSKIIIAP